LSDEEMQAFIAHAEEAADAYVRGDMDRYLELVPHADTFTLMPPYGGPAGRHRNRGDAVRASTDFIKGGEARLENVETHAWGDTVVMAMIERQYGSVEGLRTRTSRCASPTCTAAPATAGTSCTAMPTQWWSPGHWTS
jgi:hypothetical protein